MGCRGIRKWRACVRMSECASAYVWVHVCVRMCECVRVYTCVRACVRVYGYIQYGPVVVGTNHL